MAHHFGSHQVLKDINLSVTAGEFVTLLGPSGSGKTTLFNIIGGLMTPAGGDVLLGGQAITGHTGHVSYMPQTPSLMPWRTVLENVELGQEIRGTADRARTLQLIERCGFTAIKDAMPSTLSGGMRQRVSFIRALNSPGSLLLLDEPFSALDEVTRIDMQQWLKEILAMEQRTVLMITHSIEEAVKLSDKVAVLEGKPAVIQQVHDTSRLSAEDTQVLRHELLDLLR
ncbi:ABC transporter ATP-binding protein [Macrococcus equipercicus]|uniref:ABC transporter ATP-binding protein n=1 Tax=Macrococcus equipercicus TaxID=69967 RepID=A0A9Q9BSF4_9STAP|nr:ABC transporter ATP-binding protein [Macrococcus equipercicus]KAA1040355.1 ABC transporter ATP-binding protein [Macrococcus equipercicus]UTH14866.1 ABC transporter ATP-binding protein [Macrococcus equipercicus]